MKTKTEDRYDVEIFEYETGKTAEVIGKNMTEKRAEKRQMTGLSRCNSNFGVRIIKLNLNQGEKNGK